MKIGALVGEEVVGFSTAATVSPTASSPTAMRGNPFQGCGEHSLQRSGLARRDDKEGSVK